MGSGAVRGEWAIPNARQAAQKEAPRSLWNLQSVVCRFDALSRKTETNRRMAPIDQLLQINLNQLSPWLLSFALEPNRIFPTFKDICCAFSENLVQAMSRFIRFHPVL